MNDQRVETWATWLDKSVANDVYLMHLERHVWREMHEVIGENNKLKNTNSYFWEWLFDIYTKTQAGAVRRQADERKDVASLGRLLVEIRKSPQLLTRDWYLDHWGKDESYDGDDKAYWRRAGEGEWAETFGGVVGDHIDPAVVGADLTELRQGSRKVKHYVNKHVAHFDEGGVGGRPKAPGKKEIELPTLNEVHDAIDLVGRLFRKYHALFTAADVIELTPVLQHDWKAVFRMQWMPELQLPKELRDYQELREREQTEGKD
jgi:HEPN superfamily AbiU2-like protein